MLLDIFSVLSCPPGALVATRVSPLCSQYFANVLPVTDSLWASSFSWCGNIKSSPPPWMSKVSPRYLIDIAEHSMCQPGRPGPQGDSHVGSPGLAAFHSAKSAGLRLPLPVSSRVPASCSSTLRCESLP